MDSLTLRTLLIHGLKDLYYAETQLLKILPKISRTAANAQLKAAFISYLAQTREHLERLNQAMGILGVPAKGRTCQSMVELIKEAIDIVAVRAPNAVRDAALIASAQRMKHYEMAVYASSRGFAQALGEIQVAYLLQTTLAEEGETSKRLITIALTVNVDAAVLEDSETILAPPPHPRKSAPPARFNGSSRLLRTHTTRVGLPPSRRIFPRAAS